MAGLCEVRGFRTVIVERPFGAPFRLGPEDPRVALCGVDNLTARRELDSPGLPSGRDIEIAILAAACWRVSWESEHASSARVS
jgi:hypothetical protein